MPRTLTVFAASSLLDAFTDLGKAYEAAHPGVTVAFNFDGSASLRAQFEQGAVADVFASANQKEMDTVAAAGLVVSGAAKPFASNVLVVILPADNPGNGVFFNRFEDSAGLWGPTINIYPNQIVTTSSETILDGKNTTIMLSENLDNNNLNWTYAPMAPWLSTDGPYAEAQLGMVWWLNAPVDVPATPLWQVNGNEYLPLGGQSLLGDPAIEYARPSAYHPGGVVMTFVGGNSRFVSDSISYSVYCLLMSSNQRRVAPPAGSIGVNSANWIGNSPQVLYILRKAIDENEIP